MKAVTIINTCSIVSSFVGLVLSLYAYSIELNKEHDPDYQALCDISDYISCSKVFLSEYGKGFGLVTHLVGEDSVLNQPNSLMGIVFYAILIVLSCVNSTTWTKVLVALTALSNVTSVYLAYILFVVLQDLCVVCISTYVVNFISLLLAVTKLKKLSPKISRSSRKRKKKN
ncbi:vitamin K epoxide reductase complex subunit 1 [Bacillus rossius redtenbacheri]|uniref:vitamin K epoxide reductase complex subunit 1 n=1 Tax=Bacillus rossius redtenbacheri TaxID=93214 RepID=UPI002FDD7F08